MLSNMFAIAENGQIDLVISGFYFESWFADKNHDLRFRSYPTTFSRKFYCSKEEFKSDFVKLWDKHLLYNICNKLYRLDLIKKYKLQFSSISFGEDLIFNKIYLLKCNRFCIDENCYYHYVRERSGASTTKYIDDLFNIRAHEHEEMTQYFEEYGITGEEANEFLARRHIERVIGCIENTFNNPSKDTFITIYKNIKNITRNFHTRESLRFARPHSHMMRLMLLPIKAHNTFITVLMGEFIHFVRKNHPEIFTKLKQNR